MKIALVHDWLTGMRGGERVLEAMARLYPQAPIYTLLHHRGSLSPLLESREIHTTFLQHMPFPAAYRWYLPLFPRAIESLDLRHFDVVLSSSHCAAKAVRPAPEALHLCYCHTPMRYAWDQFDAYFSPARQGRLAFAVIRRLIDRLRRWDRQTVDRVHAFAANSAYVAGRIRRFYDRDAEVIPPPVDTTRFVPTAQPAGDYYLMVTALSPYKRIDIAIEAFRALQRPLVIVGWGPEQAHLQRLAGGPIRLAGRVGDAELVRLYQGSRGLLLPGIEDAGIAPLEAMACGRPALVLGDGGAPESVIDGVTGVHIAAPTTAAIVGAVDRAEALSFNTQRIRAHAEGYSEMIFEARLRAFVDRHVQTAFARPHTATGPRSKTR